MLEKVFIATLILNL